MKKGDKITILGNVYVANTTLNGYTLFQAKNDLNELLRMNLVSLAIPKLYVIYRVRAGCNDKLLVKTSVYYSNEEVLEDLKNMYYASGSEAFNRYEFKAEMVDNVGKFNVELKMKENEPRVGAAPGGCSNRNLPF